MGYGVIYENVSANVLCVCLDVHKNDFWSHKCNQKPV